MTVNNNKKLEWIGKGINLECYFCGETSEIDSCLLNDADGNLFADVICEDCFNKLEGQ